MKIIKRLLLALLLAPLTLLAVTVVFVALVDPNDYRNELEALGSTAFGRDLKIKGPIDFAAGLVPVLRMSDVVIANPAWASDPHLAKLDVLEGRVELWRALRGDLGLAGLSASGGEVFLEVRPDGSSNYAFAESDADGGPAGHLPDLELSNIAVVRRDVAGGSWHAEVHRWVFRRAADGSLETSSDLSYGSLAVRIDGKRGEASEAPWRILIEVGDVAQLKASGHFTDLFGAEGVVVAITGDDVKNLARRFEVSAPFAGKLDLSARLRLTDDAYRIAGLEGTVGDSDVSGDISVVRGGPRFQIHARLSSNRLVIEPFRLQDAKASTLVPDFTIPVDALRRVDLDLGFKAKVLDSGHGTLADVELAPQLTNGHLVVSRIAATDASGSRMQGRFELDASRDTPEVAVTLDADDFDLGLLLENMGWASGVQEHIDVDVSLTGRGADRTALLGSLEGRAVVISNGGTIANRNLDLWAADIVTTMLSPKWRRSEETKLLCGVASLTVGEGAATIEHLLIDSERITVAGSGNVSLVEETLDIVLAPKPKQVSLVSLARPVRIEGPWADVTVSSLKLTSLERTAKIGALSVLNPLFLLASFTSTGTLDKNACVETLAQVKASGAASGADT